MLNQNDELTTFDGTQDEVETIVGPSVKVEGDFVSKGNVVIEGTVMGSVRTEKNLRVEEGAVINANVHAENIRVAGEVRGNVQVAGLLELTSTARVLGDVHTKTLVVAAGALLHGSCGMTEEKMVKPPSNKKGRVKEEEFAVEFEDSRQVA